MRSEGPVVSVVVPVLNESHVIERCLDSLAAQDTRHEYEILVVDNGSTDDTVTRARGYSRVRVLHQEGTLGRARQTGLEQARGEYVAFLDADEVAVNSWLSHLIKVAEVHGAAVGPVLPLKASGKVADYFQIAHQMHSIHYTERIVSGRIVTFGAGNLIVKRAMALSVGFDSMFPTGEDGDFSYRWLRTGFGLGFSEDARVFHDLPSSLGGMYVYHRKLSFGLGLLARKHHDAVFIRLYLVSLLYPMSPPFARRFRSVAGREALGLLPLGMLEALAYAIPPRSLVCSSGPPDRRRH